MTASYLLQVGIAILDCSAHGFDEFGDDVIRELVVRQAFAEGHQIDPSRETAPVLRQSAAGAHVTRREMRLGDWPRGALVTEETAQIGERRAGKRELPVENRGYSPSSAGAAHQQVPFVKVAVHEAGFAIELG